MRCTARSWSAFDFGLASAYSCSMVFMRARIAGLKNPAMRDDAFVRFTAHEIPREDLHALMARSDGPALRRIGDILRLASGRADRPWMAPSERRPLIIEARAYLTVYLAVAAVSIAVGSPAALVVWI